MKRKNLLIGGLLLLLCLCVTPVYAVTNIKYQNTKTPSMENVNGLTDKELVKRATIGNKEVVITSNTKRVVVYEGEGYPKEYYEAPNYSINYSTNSTNYQKKSLNSIIKNTLNITIDDNHRPKVESLYAVNGEFYIFLTISTITRTKNEQPDVTYTRYLIKSSDGVNFKKVDIPNYNHKYVKLQEYDGTYIMNAEISFMDNNDNKTYTYYISKDLVNWTKKEFDTSIFGIEKNYYVRPRKINRDGVIFSSDDYNLGKVIYVNTTDFENYQIYDGQDDLEDILGTYEANAFMDVYDYFKNDDPNDHNLFLILSNTKDSTIKLVHYKDYQKSEHTEYHINLTSGVVSDYAFKDNKFIFIYTKDEERSIICFDLQTQVLKKIKLPAKSENFSYEMKHYYFTNDYQYLVFATSNGFQKMKLYDMYNAEIIKNIPGDLNGDEEIGLTDVLISLKMYFNGASNMTGDQKDVADLNGDNKFDLTDILMLLKAYFNSSN